MRLRELVFFSLEKERLRDLINMYCHKLKYRKFPLNNYFTVRLVKHLEQVTQRGLAVSILEDSQSLTGCGPEQLALLHPALSRLLH